MSRSRPRCSRLHAGSPGQRSGFESRWALPSVHAWPSGRGSGLPSRRRGFDSRRVLLIPTSTRPPLLTYAPTRRGRKPAIQAPVKRAPADRASHVCKPTISWFVGTPKRDPTPVREAMARLTLAAPTRWSGRSSGACSPSVSRRRTRPVSAGGRFDAGGELRPVVYQGGEEATRAPVKRLIAGSTPAPGACPHRLAGQGRRPLTAETRVRIPVGTPRPCRSAARSPPFQGGDGGAAPPTGTRSSSWRSRSPSKRSLAGSNPAERTHRSRLGSPTEEAMRSDRIQ